MDPAPCSMKANTTIDKTKLMRRMNITIENIQNQRTARVALTSISFLQKAKR